MAALFTYIRLHSGKKFDYNNLDINSIDIEDIAHSLSQQNRYVGHCHIPYNIAQHSILVSRNLPQHLKLQGLLHDASEVYLGDVNSMLKSLLPEYQVLEKKVEKLCMDRFGLSYPFDEEVKKMDKRLLTTELRDTMPGEDYKLIEQEYPPINMTIEPWGQKRSKYKFLTEFHKLYNGN